MYVSGFQDRPSHYVDITDTFDKKIEALKEHQSQLAFLSQLFQTDFLEIVELQARLSGKQCGVKYAEAFKECAVYPRVRPYRVLP